ncbi:protein disulfide-isomerase A4-like [Centruroides vittatus]|uniref:protein disulfide-isomerase A4-like n=1 Tax=Centruroides vittatus TaxID=120091 RepID=UPI00350F0FCB
MGDMRRLTLIAILFFASFNFLDFVKSQDEDQEEDIPIVEGRGTVNIPEDDDVIVLNKDNFDLVVLQRDIILVEFYAPWCGHCQALAPEYAKAAKMLKEETPPIPLAKLDATVETELASQYDVSGYPTLYIFRKGVKYPYEGPRSALGIVEHMKEQADPNWKPPPEMVIFLTKENFTETVNKAEIILVEFYAPWCGHCKRLAPEYERAARQLANRSPPIPLAKVDGIAEKELANQYEVSGWPTLLIFRRGQKYTYDGPRDESGIVKHMIEQASSPSTEVVSIKSLENNLKKNDPVVVGYFKDQDHFYKEYIEAANNLRGKFNFYHTFDKNAIKHFHASEETVVLYQPEIFHSKYEKPKYIFSEKDGSSQEIVEFLNKNVLPLVGQRTRSNMWRYSERFPLVIVYYDVDFSFEHRVQTQLIRQEVVKAAAKYKGKITFCISNEEEFEDELVDLGLDDSGEDVNVGYFQSRNVRYQLQPDDDFSSDILQQFINDVKEGNVSPHIKSLPAPKNNKGPVITVVGSTFDSLVTKNEKDILLEFYAPWCQHCKKLEPVYKKLAKKFVNNKNLMIAKIDATANDYPEKYQIKGYPTIYYIPAFNKENLIAYEGSRELDDLTKFVNKNLGEDKQSEKTKDEL